MGMWGRVHRVCVLGGEPRNGGWREVSPCCSLRVCAAHKSENKSSKVRARRPDRRPNAATRPRRQPQCSPATRLNLPRPAGQPAIMAGRPESLFDNIMILSDSYKVPTHQLVASHPPRRSFLARPLDQPRGLPVADLALEAVPSGHNHGLLLL